MDNTKFLKTLLAVVEKQQAALKKLAQGGPPAPNPEPPPQAGLGDASHATKRTVDAINENLPANLKMGGPLVARLEVDENKNLLKVQLVQAVRQNQAKAQQVVNALSKLISEMQNTNKVVRRDPLTVTVV